MNTGNDSGFLWVIGICIASGYFLYSAIHNRGTPQYLRPGDALELFVLGSCGFVYAESFLLYAGMRMRPWHLLVFLAIAVIFCLWRRARLVGIAWRQPGGAASRTLALLPLLLAILLLLDYMVLTLSNPQFDIDMLAHILTKGKILSQEGLWDSPYLNDPGFANLHSRYPLFPAIIYGNFYQWGPGNVNSYLFTNFLLIAGIAASLYSWLRNSLSPWMSALWTSTYVSAHGFLDFIFIMSSTEIMLSAVFFCAARHFYEWNSTGDKRELSMVAAFAGMAMLVKNDALLFSCALFAVAAISGAGRTLWRPALIWAAIASPWLIISMQFPDVASGPALILRNASLTASLPNLRVPLPAFVRSLFEGWNAAFSLASILFACLIFRKKRPPVFGLFTVSAMTILGYCFIIWLYIGTDDSFEKTFYRLVCPLYPFTLVCVALTLNTWVKHVTPAFPVTTNNAPETT